MKSTGSSRRCSRISAGSTALAERLDDEEVKLVVGEAIGRVVTEVERLGGYVKDLAGDGVLAFFGAPTSVSRRR